MNVKTLVLVIVLLLFLLCSATAAPMASTEHSKGLEVADTMRSPTQQNPGRGGRNQRPSGWRRRRPRPRLSHKGPMPF
ncbi:apelin [Denticeps clupeoides]|uniref:apelin n=1 Tax=Denticeps clupeoides TaxID=299321 RepID=UPI0010A4D753|nr:apelin [Denticeps clupeoides]